MIGWEYRIEDWRPPPWAGQSVFFLFPRYGAVAYNLCIGRVLKSKTNDSSNEVVMGRDDGKRFRLEKRLYKQRQSQKVEYSVLFRECVDALANGVIIFSHEQSSVIYDRFQAQYPLLDFGKINWEKVNHEVVTIDRIRSYFDDYPECYVLWSHGNDPVIRAALFNVIKNLDDVLAVSPDVWVFKEDDFVIEFSHDGTIKVGYLNEVPKNNEERSPLSE
ncbi:hypothetical protein [Paenibacillus flagellatus]|uniref:CDI toxin immunity protein n=1 Tax=Paenibacillus flagellatus TaxID=2211139 RepID=UPI0011B7B5A1|nr:hypothetical protein [Paenibacillus flagellatus]